ncbi:MAG: murein transglycosylase domain-containing protein [Gammaproteobacteria bacterium]|nr:murein transglycosylase domain-containing protein [Gammaproteobacteria bacterium]MDH5802628.1 murein transglycosylase domain-containing protein [Gammaproteobacteria bacterium]
MQLSLLVAAMAVPSQYSIADHTESHQLNKFMGAKKAADLELLRRNEEVREAYDKFKKVTAVVWGNEAVVPSADIEVTYRDNLSQRSVVNYEHGTVKVELAVSPTKAKYQDGVQQKMAGAVQATIVQPPDDRSIVEMAKQPEPPPSEGEPMLKGLVAGQDGKPLSPDKMDAFRKEQLKAVTQRDIEGSDGRKRTVFSTEFKLVPDHIRIRAKKYRHMVDKNSVRHNIPAHLIYAIIETESFFNPRAKSPVPAFGLMQLVPQTGARDAYRFLYARDKIVKDTYLYKPNNNIKLGVAYLHMLHFRYLKRIKDPVSRQWAAIAAYNTGVDNVMGSFAGQYSKKKFTNRWIWKGKALKKINKMNPEQVYQHLRKYLPYEETREYIKKVRDRMHKYQT